MLLSEGLGPIESMDLPPWYVDTDSKEPESGGYPKLFEARGQISPDAETIAMILVMDLSGGSAADIASDGEQYATTQNLAD